MPPPDPALGRQGGGPAHERQAGRPAVTADDLDLAEPGGPDADAERLQDRLLGGEARRQAGPGIPPRLGVGAFGVGEEAVGQARDDGP